MYVILSLLGVVGLVLFFINIIFVAEERKQFLVIYLVGSGVIALFGFAIGIGNGDGFLFSTLESGIFAMMLALLFAQPLLSFILFMTYKATEEREESLERKENEDDPRDWDWDV